MCLLIEREWRVSTLPASKLSRGFDRWCFRDLRGGDRFGGKKSFLCAFLGASYQKAGVPRYGSVWSGVCHDFISLFPACLFKSSFRAIHLKSMNIEHGSSKWFIACHSNCPANSPHFSTEFSATSMPCQVPGDGTCKFVSDDILSWLCRFVFCLQNLPPSPYP